MWFFCFRVLMVYHAELILGLRWSICTLQSIVLVRHNPRNFVSDKLKNNLFLYCKFLFISWAFFVLNECYLFFSKFSNNKFVVLWPSVMVLVATTRPLSWAVHLQHCMTVTGLQCTVIVQTGKESNRFTFYDKDFHIIFFSLIWKVKGCW
jgi:hypothetical protein